MKNYGSESIRNVALLGHGGCGKTTFLEAALFATGVTKKLGSVSAGNTVSDYDKMEIEKGFSINTALVPVEWKDTKINFIDTPGYPDFAGEVNAALRAAEAAVIMVDAGAGIQVGTEQAWKACEKHGTPRFFIINKRDKDEFDFDATFSALQDQFGSALVPLSWPLTDEIDEDLMEAIASADEELMEKYFEGEEFTDVEIKQGMAKGIQNGDIIPVCSTLFTMGGGVEELLDLLAGCVPTPAMHAPYQAVNGKGEDVEVACSTDGPLSAFVFKTVIDPFVGKISIMKILTGKVTPGAEAYNSTSEKSEKLGKPFFLRGKNQIELNSAEAGDIIAVAKLANTETGDTLCDKTEAVACPKIELPAPCYFIAVEAKDKNDEDKMGSSLRRLMEEDPSFVVERNPETRQTLLGGQGDMQLNIVLSKLKDRFGVEVNTVPQKIAYRETIKGESDVQGKHKKQSGGAGQYGDVHIRFSPSQEEFEFSEELFGGAIPKNYVPAVEKGLRESMENGPLAGCRVQNIKAVLYDGSYHDVDSNEVSFKIAASLAFKKGIKEANPILLEPIMRMEIMVPNDYTGDVMGDLTKRRGRILGMEPQPNGDQKLDAIAPQAELFDYALGLRAMTQGRGSFTMTFDNYSEVPKNLADEIIAQHEAEENK